MKEKKFLTVREMVLIAVFTALISACSLIQIPAGVIPFTLQTFAIFTTAGLLGAKKGTISVIIYILLGVMGVPVFAGGKSGPGVIIGPTGGYITGFIFTVLIISLIMRLLEKNNIDNNIVITIFAMILGDAVCMIIGTVQFMAVMDTGAATALSCCVMPFIIPDLVKMFVSFFVINRVKKYIKIFD